MTSPTFNRPPRPPLPPLPTDEIDLPAPPSAPPPPAANWLVSVLPVLGIGVMALFYLWRSFTVPGSSAFFAMPLFVLAVFAIAGTVIAGRWRKQDYERTTLARQRDYIRVLERRRARLQAAHDAARGILSVQFPAALTGLDTALARGVDLWARRGDDPDFGVMRLGVGDVPAPVPVNLADSDADSPEFAHAQHIADAYRTLHAAPVTLALRQHWAVGVCGPRADSLAAVRAMLCGLAVAHAPGDLLITVIAANADDWAWVNWLPHAQVDARHTRLATTTAQVRAHFAALSQALDARRGAASWPMPLHLVVMDGPSLADSEAAYAALLQEGRVLGAAALCIAADYAGVPGECSAVVQLNGEAFALAADGQTLYGYADMLTVAEAEAVARALASVTARDVGAGGRIPARVGLLELYGVRHVDAVPDLLAARWNRTPPDGVLPFPVPVGREGLTTDTVLRLDEDHHGPHGVLAGTTGSGKSELLQTLVCALAIEHSPRYVNFLLIDFKGGSAFSAFARLPHTVGTVTNLDGALVERALAALTAEITDRQAFLKALNLRDITQYHRYHPDGEPLPHLFVIVDEFAQLAREMPAFLSELVKTAQVGRSLGLHLILGTQSPMDVITDEMNANLQFRICLRVQNAEASRAMLRRPDAAYLPAGLAGRGYLQVGERGVYKQFQTAYAGGEISAGTDEEPLVLELLTDDGTVIDLLADEDGHISHHPGDTPRTTASALVDYISAYAERHSDDHLRPLLLPPLGPRITLEDAFVHFTFGGWNGERWRGPGFDEDGGVLAAGCAPIGLVDDVHTRKQSPLWVRLGGDGQSDGHLLVIGAPGSGKTTALQTLALSMAVLNSPERLHLYLLSFAGRGLAHLGHLPHAERAIHGGEPERVRRLFGRLLALLDARKASRSRTHEPLILLCLDGFEAFRDRYYEQHMPDFERLMSEGRAVGICVAFTANTVGAVPDRVRALVAQRVALNLNNTGEYLLAVGGAKPSGALPPGRGYVGGTPPLLCQIALPTFGAAARGDVEAQTRRLVNEMRQGTARRGQMQAPAPIAELPAFIPLDALEPVSPHPGELVTVLGQADDDDLSPYALDWDADGPHFVVTGPPGSGKTNLLHAAALSAAMVAPPDALRLLLWDFTGRSLSALAPLKHTLAHITHLLDVDSALTHLADELTHLDGVEHPPRTVLLIDDYEVAADALSSNLDFLRQLRDHIRLHSHVGLHIWAAGTFERAGDPLVKQLLLRRNGFALASKEGLAQLNVRAAGLPNDPMPDGRAFVAQHNRVQVVQTALVDDVAGLVAHINGAVWGSASSARWMHPARELPAPPSDGGERGAGLDIDTAGLIDDLLGGG